MMATEPDRRMPLPQPEYDRTLFTSTLVKIGKFRCPSSHPDFKEPATTESYCFAFPRSASWIEHESGGRYLADPTVIPLHNPGRRFWRRPIRPEGHHSDWFAVQRLLLEEMVGRHEPAATRSPVLFRFSAVRSQPRMYVAQRQVFRHVVTDAQPDQLFVESTVLDFMSSVLDSAYNTARSELSHRHSRSLADDAREHLHQTFRSSQGLAELAATLGCSPYHLCRVFVRETGWTIHQYRSQLRLRRSLDLLASGADILEAALYLGYSGHSHFTEAFHRAFGITPSQFKTVSRARPLCGAPRVE